MCGKQNIEKEKGLEEEIRSFEEERENVRKIIGRIGGVPDTRTHIINFCFAVLVISVFALSIIWGGRMRYLMIEVGILLLSLKFIYFLASHTRLNHFQFWILSSLEWRLDKIEKSLKEINRKG
ncbi:MAG: hypothetical protein GF408_04480 [Candidatus Omnitrophica bacterium]|nr:hypothetical protein [Candidatus Omnitrophota bacterium]